MLGNTSGKSNSGLAPGDIQTVYGLQGAAFNGSGQTVALVEFDGYTPSDILGYESAYLITPIQVTPVSVDGASNTPGSGAGEVTLDIEMVAAVAPGVSQILVYEAPNSWQGNYDLYNKIATDDIAKIVSTSWGQPELDLGASLANVESQIYQRMAIQGQTIYAASGDNGAFDVGAAPTNNCNGTSKLCVDDPASQPYVTGVGGTSLSGTIQNYTEATWNDASGASGGGISAIWPIPSYQSSINTTANGGSSTMRNVPDVALNADPISSPYSIYFQGGWWSVGGTSAAAPLWAAFTALINQRNAGLGDATLGFANPTLYELATSTSSSTLFNDITIGNNGYYNAGPGYDDATGWGSFKGSALLGAVITGPAPIDYSALASVYAYPNPWDIRRETQRLITFANLPDGATVKIFTLSGFLVRTLTVSGSTAVWDLTNASGQMVASGLYLYLASDGSHNTTGKIAIIK
jgi:kumamolisin